MEAKEIIEAFQSGKINAEQATRLIESYERKKTKKKEPKPKGRPLSKTRKEKIIIIITFWQMFAKDLAKLKLTMKLRYVLADGLKVGDSYINTVLADYNSAKKKMDLLIKQVLIPGESIQTIIIDKNKPNEPLTYQEATLDPSIFNNVVNELIQTVKQSN